MEKIAKSHNKQNTVMQINKTANTAGNRSNGIVLDLSIFQDYFRHVLYAGKSLHLNQCNIPELKKTIN